jgi:hypothetical protein
VFDCPEGDYLGGHAVVSKGRNHSPLSVTYGWAEDKECYLFEIALISTSSLISIAEHPAEVAHAKDEQEAVNIANDTSGGEADIVGDVAQGVFGVNVVLLDYGAMINVGLDQHEDAIAWLTRRIKELVQ